MRKSFIYSITISLFLGPACFATMLQDLDGYWPFDEGGGDLVTDISIHARNGTRMGDTVWQAGISNDGLLFDGDDDYVTVDQPQHFDFDVTDSFSISVWVKSDTAQNTSIVGKCCRAAPSVAMKCT